MVTTVSIHMDLQPGDNFSTAEIEQETRLGGGVVIFPVICLQDIWKCLMVILGLLCLLCLVSCYPEDTRSRGLFHNCMRGWEPPWEDWRGNTRRPQKTHVLTLLLDSTCWSTNIQYHTYTHMHWSLQSHAQPKTHFNMYVADMTGRGQWIGSLKDLRSFEIDEYWSQYLYMLMEFQEISINDTLLWKPR